VEGWEIGGRLMKKRLHRLLLTFIGKKYVAWVVCCVFCWFGKISGTDLVFLTGAIFTLDLFTKMKVPAPMEVE
jgi:hypothetical protein